MADKEKNIFAKLAQARIDFASKKVKPSGYNSHLDFEYLELGDIVPVANKVMQNNGLILLTSFGESGCVGNVVDVDDPTNMITFTVDYQKPEVDVRSKSNAPIQICGADMTYLRRYLWYLVLDITVNDEVDAETPSAPVVKPATKSTPKKTEAKEEPKKASTAKVVVSSAKKAPVTSSERKEIAKELTDSSAMADELQINSLKALMLRWVNAVPEDKPEATNILVSTNGFANCTKKEADELIDKITKKIEESES